MESVGTCLMHHGIKGQKWGVRLYQHSDGSLTAAGRLRYGTKTNFEKVQSVKRAGERMNSKENKRRARQNARTEKEVAKYKKKYGLDGGDKADTEKKQQKMTYEELKAANDYDREYKKYQQNHTQQSAAKKVVSSVMTKVILPAAADVGKEYVKKELSKKLISD